MRGWLVTGFLLADDRARQKE